ncbi:phenoloxidase-activating factor 2-like [Drosophila teissieri]|uniref:phenoloxidase-activating factor 2-like n=1 Tax=Drosophila teissieri TaxID=7243 RepID=UPI001CBA28F7|nr:phenoloxidase-activating factor 2-like [Drosophila teissieri]
MGSIVATAAILLVCVLLSEACKYCVPAEECSDPKNINSSSQFPWVVAIIYKGVYWAGGSLIHPKVVLTAAHITLSMVANKTVVWAGEFDMNSTNEPFQHEERNVERIVRHEGFVYGTGANNLALIFVKTMFGLKDHIGIIALPNPQTSFEGRRCTVVGWEKESSQERHFGGIMRQVELPMVDRATCEDQLKKANMGRDFQLAQSLICAGGERDRDICFGSGGSGLFCPLGGENPHAYVQAGIVVWGIDCGSKDIPGTYTNVAMFRSWVDQMLIYWI